VTGKLRAFREELDVAPILKTMPPEVLAGTDWENSTGKKPGNLQGNREPRMVADISFGSCNKDDSIFFKTKKKTTIPALNTRRAPEPAGLIPATRDTRSF
jgi:hypothetical protein